MFRRSLLLLVGLVSLLLAAAPPGAAANARRSAPISAVTAPSSPAQASPTPAASAPDPDADAVALAKRVLAGGDDASAALLTALPEAGFTVLADDGSVVLAPTDAGQGLAFGSWEAAAMLASEGSFSTTLADAGMAFAGAIPELNAAPLDQYLLSGMQDAANGANPSLRFWARFIAALGQQANPAVDPLTATDTATVQLDAVQFALVMRRLAGDLYSFAQQNGAAAGAISAGTPPDARYLGARQSGAPCTQTQTEGVVMDSSALGTSIGFTNLLNYLTAQGIESAETIGKVTGWANLALAYAKLAYTMIEFSPAIQMEGAPPLVRTKQASPATGELRQFDATVKLDIDKTQIVNCLRPMLNAMGLDLSVPNGGAVAGADVNWYPRDGFDKYIVQFHDNPLHQTTDANGTTTIGIEGTGQAHDLPDNARPVLKPASVGIGVAIKPDSFLQDAIDASSAVGAGPAAPLAALPELLYRSNWTFDAVYHFQVQDWEVVHYHGEGTTEFKVQPVGLNFGAETQNSTFSIDFDAPGDGKDILGSGTLTVTQNSSQTDGVSSCFAMEDGTYNIRLTGAEIGGTLNLILVLDGQPQPTCFLTKPPPPYKGDFPPTVTPVGSVMLPDAQPDPVTGVSGLHSGTVAIADKDGATVTVPYSEPLIFDPGYFSDSGTFTLTLHGVDDASQ
jgi:hypothetical protein